MLAGLATGNPLALEVAPLLGIAATVVTAVGLVLIRLYGLFEPSEALALVAVVLALLLYAVATPLTLPVAGGAMLLAGLWGMWRYYSARV